MKSVNREVGALMARQYGLILRDEAVHLGLTSAQIKQRVRSGEWVRVHPGVYRLAAVPRGPGQALLAACLAAGPQAVASHQSAAWMWGLLRRPPARPTVSVPWPVHPSVAGAVVHRSRDLDPARTIERRGIPCTDPLRAACDLAAELPAAELEAVVDSALAGRLLSTEGLLEEAARRRVSGRRGPAALRQLLVERGMVGGPEPSVLEAAAMRLFRRWGIPVIGREVRFGPEGQYRIDFLIAPGLVVEVDGFAYHWTPEAKARDEARRNELRLGGLFILVYSWRDIRYDGRRVGREVTSALRRFAA